MSYLFSVSTTYNSNINRETKKGVLLEESKGLLPPFTKKYYSEQYNGRETSTQFYWDSEDESCQGYNTRRSTCHVDKERYNSPSDYYTQFIELWCATRLVAIICGEEYQTPQEHLEEREGNLWVDRNSCDCTKNLLQYSNRKKAFESNGENGLIQSVSKTLYYPSGYSEEFLIKNYPEIKRREISVLIF